MSHYDEVNRQQRAGEDQAERLWERRQDALTSIRKICEYRAIKGQPFWGIQGSSGYIMMDPINRTKEETWADFLVSTNRMEESAIAAGFTAVQITAENAKRIEDFSDGSEPTEKWVQRDDGSWEVVPV